MKKLGKLQWMENRFAKALGISAILALGMISIVFGVVRLFAEKGNPVPLPALLMAFAIIFVLGSVFFEERGADRIGALVGGGIAAVAVSLVMVLICGGVLYLLENGMQTGIDRVVSMLAVCMVLGMVAFNYITHHIG